MRSGWHNWYLGMGAADPKHLRTFVFVPHRGGSMFLHWLTLDVAKHTGRPYYSPNAGANVLAMERIYGAPSAALAGPGIYGPLRGLVDIPSPASARVIVQLRDPRDVLVSMFYSYCYSHPGEVPGGTSYRLDVAERGIDEFVLTLATADRFPYRGAYGTGGPYWRWLGSVAQRYERFLDFIDCNPSVAVLAYEEMVLDFRNWLDRFCGAFEVRDARFIEALDAKHRSNPPRAENVHRHRRQSRPGDYASKLLPPTITALDAIFSRYLRWAADRCERRGSLAEAAS